MSVSCYCKGSAQCRRPFWELQTARSRPYRRIFDSVDIRGPKVLSVAEVRALILRPGATTFQISVNIHGAPAEHPVLRGFVPAQADEANLCANDLTDFSFLDTFSEISASHSISASTFLSRKPSVSRFRSVDDNMRGRLPDSLWDAADSGKNTGFSKP